MRRVSGRLRPLTIVGIVGIFLVLALATFFLWIRPGNAFGKLEKLDAASYAESSKSFQGGVYFVEGTLEEMLDASSIQGRLVSLAVSSSQGVILIPVLIPPQLGSFNLQKGQLLKMKVKGVNRGLLSAEKIEKSL